MRSGIETTFRLLTKTENRTAADLLARLRWTARTAEIRLRAVAAALARPDIRIEPCGFRTFGPVLIRKHTRFSTSAARRSRTRFALR